MDSSSQLATTKAVKAPKQSLFRKIIRQRYLLMMVIPGIIWLLIFCYRPMYGVIIAFKDYDVTTSIKEAPWVGFQNFLDFFEDDNLGLIFKNTLGISLLNIIFGFPIPIIFALFLNELQSVKFKKFVQTVSYLPHFISWVVLGGILMNWVSDVGIVNKVLVGLHLIKQPISLLAYPKYFWGIAVISGIWKELGWGAILYLAAIAGISPELYEAATVDGAGRFRKMFSITLPCIKGTIAIMFILTLPNLLNSNFDQIFILGNSLNRSASDVLDMYVYRMGIESGNYSFSTAIGLFKSVIGVFLLLITNFTTKRLTDSSLF